MLKIWVHIALLFYSICEILHTVQNVVVFYKCWPNILQTQVVLKFPILFISINTYQLIFGIAPSVPWFFLIFKMPFQVCQWFDLVVFTASLEVSFITHTVPILYTGTVCLDYMLWSEINIRNWFFPEIWNGCDR
jgi:hypothetical protein